MSPNPPFTRERERERTSHLVSIVIPVYNVEAYLNQCLDSIVNQSYTNLEILIVNDGSTDNSLAICQEYAQQDKRIRLFSQPNGGLSQARNRGMTEITGTYLTFVDSDDWLHPNTISSCIELAEKQSLDCVEFGVSFAFEGGIIQESISRGNSASTGKEALEQALLGYVALMACCKLYRTDILQGITFIPKRYHEDVPFFFEVFSRVNRYAYLPEAFYFYRQGRAGAITETFSPKRLDTFLNIDDLITKYQSEHPEYIPYLNSLALFLMKLYYFDVYSTPAREEGQRILNPWIKKLRGRDFLPRPLRNRLQDILFLYVPSLVARLVTIRKK